MIQTDLPDGPASPLVRGLAACLSSVTEVPLAALSDLGDLPVATHSLRGRVGSPAADRSPSSRS